jgi:hypothetical protein
MCQIILYICLHTLFFWGGGQKNGGKGFIRRSLSPSVTNDQVTLKAFKETFYFKVPNLTREIRFFCITISISMAAYKQQRG